MPARPGVSIQGPRRQPTTTETGTGFLFKSQCCCETAVRPRSRQVNRNRMEYSCYVDDCQSSIFYYCKQLAQFCCMLVTKNLRRCFHPRVDVLKRSILNRITTEPGNTAIAFRGARTMISRSSAPLVSSPKTRAVLLLLAHSILTNVTKH